jgi:indole-3-acetaldehyde oxidase
MGSSGKKDALVGGRRVVLAVNGVRYEAAGADLSMSLIEFLRTRTAVRGPKLGCAEGETPSSRVKTSTSDLLLN